MALAVRTCGTDWMFSEPHFRKSSHRHWGLQVAYNKVNVLGSTFYLNNDDVARVDLRGQDWLACNGVVDGKEGNMVISPGSSEYSGGWSLDSILFLFV